MHESKIRQEEEEGNDFAEEGELNDRQSRRNINSQERSSRSGIHFHTQLTEFYFHIKPGLGVTVAYIDPFSGSPKVSYPVDRIEFQL